jgi:Dolichyl-phosphate-mannose-protein mannosyltransferase
MPRFVTRRIAAAGAGTAVREPATQPTRARQRLRERRLPERAWLLSQARTHWMLVAGVAAGLLARLVFWLVTQRRFEDGLITITHARNAAHGLGLIHHPGEGHVQGFTSAISVLVPLVGELIGHAFHKGGGFFAIRSVSLLAFVATMVYAYLLARRLGVGRWPTFFVLAYLAFEYNQIFYGMAGMETQIAVAVLLAGVFHVMRGEWVLSGALLGLGVLSRPDFLLWVAPAIVAIFLRSRRGALKAAAAGTAVVLPWLIFTTAYYGSPVPNTIHAKADRYLSFPKFSDGPAHWVSWGWDRIQANGDFWHIFAPWKDNGFVLKAPLSDFFLANVAGAFIVLAIAGAYISWRRTPTWRPAIVFALLFVAYRMFVLPPGYYEWYLPPFTAICVLLAGVGLTRLANLIPKTVVVVSVLFAALFAAHYPASVHINSVIQHDIENDVRVQVGLWLKGHVPPGHPVVSESAGYVGYYSNVKLYDYPGLTSPTSVRVLKKAGPEKNNIITLIQGTQPDWIVLRPTEFQALQASDPQLVKKYQLAIQFVAPPSGNNLDWGGVEYVNIDRDFLIFHKIGTPELSS